MWIIGLLIFWLVCAKISLWRYEKDFPDIEKDMMENDDTINAMGHIPPRQKFLAQCVICLLAPFFAVLIVKTYLHNSFTIWRLGLAINRLTIVVAQMKKERPDDPTILGLEKKLLDLRESIREMQ